MEIIAIDIDGTLTGNELECQLYSKWLGRKIKPSELTDYDVTKVLGMTKEFEKLKWLENAFYFYKNVEIDEIATKKIMEIASGYDHVIIMTKRFGWSSTVTSEWLDTHNIRYDKLVCTNEYSKMLFLDAYGITGIVEDNPYLTREIKNCRKGIKTYLVERPYNSVDDCDVYIKGSF
ncbi:hypothetical protein [Enterococcus termitis]|uniref:Nucleotidase n=1 Tax=Enterococcus termitis TaxID=332950 RepID=A0A1E5GVT5_9ENTE|nr:hypothetical protein [Enterococcus termitis]OEG16792.1 hypothetical protein BCR25_04130 [Enterococcus termitis]OJG99501.1 hypothetical protein RV18_GL001569 [Enterococcus termitis]